MTNKHKIEALRKTNFTVSQAFQAHDNYTEALETATIYLAEMLETTQNALIKCFERQNIGPIYLGNCIFPGKIPINTLNNPEEEPNHGNVRL